MPAWEACEGAHKLPARRGKTEVAGYFMASLTSACPHCFFEAQQLAKRSRDSAVVYALGYLFDPVSSEWLVKKASHKRIFFWCRGELPLLVNARVFTRRGFNIIPVCVRSRVNPGIQRFSHYVPRLWLPGRIGKLVRFEMEQHCSQATPTRACFCRLM